MKKDIIIYVGNAVICSGYIIPLASYIYSQVNV